ncbi:helicase HerA-like domain-containing protein [Candidatus Deferrimicrobium sp.]|uniref:helicase HerA-like domain-containing protein n=1 Tax=Candidatus Deferrimicrobium sp. TaxID=3060586 RepID=UPI003C701824
MANRHGLIAGATGTGKTVTLRVLAERFSAIGVPVFLADVKGDLSGIPRPGGDNPKVVERVAKLGLAPFAYEGYPVTFWDLFGEQGHPVRATVSEMGPLLLGRILNLNDIQGGVLGMIFRIADDNGLLLLDLKDLREMVRFVGDNAGQFRTEYGNVTAASVGAIQRGLLTLEEQGGDRFFGEPALDLQDLLQTDPSGKGRINILAASRLMTSPTLYATFLLYLLSELFERLPEVGDPDKPSLVFFFDEGHLLFTDAPKPLEQKIEQVVRLIRSKGVGVYFVTQNPLDLPETVLGQLGNRVQHALRAFTPGDQKAVKTAADTFRANPKLDVVKAITELEVGEALVSVLDPKGAPTVVERAFVLPPRSRLTPLSPVERARVIGESVLKGHYERVVDRESAYEKLKEKAAQQGAAEGTGGGMAGQGGQAGGKPSQAGVLIGAMVKSAAHAIGSQIGRQIIRGVLGSILGGRSR